MSSSRILDSVVCSQPRPLACRSGSVTMSKAAPNKERPANAEPEKFLTLEQGLAEPCFNRDLSLATTAMPNMTTTPGGPNGGVPMSFRASWELNSRPRRIALLMDDCQEEYRCFAQDILDQLVQLKKVFQSKKSDACVTVWSTWSRRFDDGISNAMDRWYGPRGLDLKNYQNALYIAEGEHGLSSLTEIAPAEQDIDDGWFYHSKHLDMFWSMDEHGQSYLDTKLRSCGIDTIVICGLWTDECILSTAFAGLSRGYDVVVVGDAVATATANGPAALTVMNGTSSQVLTTEQVCQYMETEFEEGAMGAVKGTKHADGRKD